MSEYLDLTVKGETPIILTKGIFYPALNWNIPTPPAAFTITMYGWSSGVDQVWTVGSGITIVGDDVIWDLGEVINDVGMYYGKIESDDDVYGIAFRSKIKIKIENE